MLFPRPRSLWNRFPPDPAAPRFGKRKGANAFAPPLCRNSLFWGWRVSYNSIFRDVRNQHDPANGCLVTAWRGSPPTIKNLPTAAAHTRADLGLRGRRGPPSPLDRYLPWRSRLGVRCGAAGALRRGARSQGAASRLIATPGPRLSFPACGPHGPCRTPLKSSANRDFEKSTAP